VKTTAKPRVRKDFVIPDALWEEIQPLLPKHVTHHPLGCHRKRVDDRSAMNAIFFVLKTGCQWNALNATGICSSSSAHCRFQEWCEAGVFRKLWKRCLERYDELKGSDWSFCSMDGAMTKAPLAGEKRGPNPTDRAKQGIKRSLLTEGRGLPLGCVVGGANKNDFKITRATLKSIPIKRPPLTAKRPQGLCLDKGYDYEDVRVLLKRFHFVPHIRSRGEEARSSRKDPRVKARRWVVERTHSWMNRFRAILICWTKKPENFTAQLHLACAYITLGQCGLLG